MTSATIPGLSGTDGTPPTRHSELLAWVQEVAELTQPDRVVFADGSDEEWDRLTTQLVDAGTFKQLNPDKKPNSFLALSKRSVGCSSTAWLTPWGSPTSEFSLKIGVKRRTWPVAS